MRRILLAGIALLAVTACGPSGTKPITNDAELALPTTDWPAFRDAFIEGWFKLDPANAVYQGRHDFDGGLGDWSEAGLKRQADFLRASIVKASAFDAGKLNKQDAFERDYLVDVAEGKLFWLTDADQPHTNPAWYIGAGLDPNVYIARNYADAPTRMKAMIRFLRQIPGAAANIRANLKTPMPLSFIDYGVAGFNGFADYYTGDAKKAFAGVESPALQDEFDQVAGAAAKSMHDLAALSRQPARHRDAGFRAGRGQILAHGQDDRGCRRAARPARGGGQGGPEAQPGRAEGGLRAVRAGRDRSRPAWRR